LHEIHKKKKNLKVISKPGMSCHSVQCVLAVPSAAEQESQGKNVPTDQGHSAKGFQSNQSLGCSRWPIFLLQTLPSVVPDDLG
jgi:hypothetical protein